MKDVPRLRLPSLPTRRLRRYERPTVRTIRVPQGAATSGSPACENPGEGEPGFCL